MKAKGYVAFDLGAESGRAMLATLEGEHFKIEEIHRFLNLPQRLPSGLHWNLQDLWGNLLEGLRKCGQAANKANLPLVSLGVDTWGVDMALIGQSGQLLGLPYCYRDDRHAPAMKKTLKFLGEKELYQATGIQFMPFNTLFQLVAQNASEPQTIEAARHMLFMPDLLHYFFSGKKVNEATIASTSQMINPRTGKWDKKLLSQMKIPSQFLGKIVPAGTKIGPLLPAIAKETGVGAMDVIVPGSHDTASAIAAVPVDAATMKSGDWAYLSSGTWSLMGVEIDKPLLNEETRKINFTHERCVGGKIRFLKNIAGLWLVQECRRDFAKRGQEFDYTQLSAMAEEAEPFRTLINPSHAPFSSPGEMPAKIAEFARISRQPVPQTAGQFVRCCLESLALEYRRVLENLDQLFKRRHQVLHIVGGGGRNQLLNQLTADAIGRRVIVGPFEATAIGNALTQAMGAGQVKDLVHLRRIVRSSFELQTVEPRHNTNVNDSFTRYLALLKY